MPNGMSFENWLKLEPEVREYEIFRMLQSLETTVQRRKWVNPALIIPSSFAGGFTAVWAAFKFKILGP